MHTRWLAIFWALALAGALASCGSGKEDAAPGVFPAELRWASRPQAHSYRVQAWSGLRLLFEETTADTLLPLTPALLRAMAPFDSCRIEVRVAAQASASPEVFWVKREAEQGVAGAGGGARTHTN